MVGSALKNKSTISKIIENYPTLATIGEPKIRCQRNEIISVVYTEITTCLTWQTNRRGIDKY